MQALQEGGWAFLPGACPAVRVPARLVTRAGRQGPGRKLGLQSSQGRAVKFPALCPELWHQLLIGRVGSKLPLLTRGQARVILIRADCEQPYDHSRTHQLPNCVCSGVTSKVLRGPGRLLKTEPERSPWTISPSFVT